MGSTKVMHPSGLDLATLDIHKEKQGLLFCYSVNFGLFLDILAFDQQRKRY